MYYDFQIEYVIHIRYSSTENTNVLYSYSVYMQKKIIASIRIQYATHLETVVFSIHGSNSKSHK